MKGKEFMDKDTATNVISNAGMKPRDVAHSIYLATVKGVSGANQNDGYGYILSAIAELWNIRGIIGNPMGKTKITNRYRGKGITEEMILNVVSKYPNGIRNFEPQFDALLGISEGDTIVQTEKDIDNTENPSDSDGSAVFGFIILIVYAIFKFGFGWGWIASFVAVVVVFAGVILLLTRIR